MRTRLGLLTSLMLLGSCAHPAPSATPTAPEAPATFTVTVSGHGRPVVFISDLEVSGRVWDSTLAHLGGKFEAHVIDIAGFANHPPSTGPLLPRLHDELVTYVHEHARGAVLVGHMFGGGLAYWLAMSDPEDVSGVLTIDAPPSRNGGSVDPEAEEVRQHLLSASPETYAKMVRGRLGSMVSDPARIAPFLDEAEHTTQAVDAEAFYDMMSRDLRTQITNVKAPVLTLLTTGNLPPEMVPQIEQAYRNQLESIPHHELVMVPGAHHYLMFDAPDLFFATLDRFLASTGS